MTDQHSTLVCMPKSARIGFDQGNSKSISQTERHVYFSMAPIPIQLLSYMTRDIDRRLAS